MANKRVSRKRATGAATVADGFAGPDDPAWRAQVARLNHVIDLLWASNCVEAARSNKALEPIYEWLRELEAASPEARRASYSIAVLEAAGYNGAIYADRLLDMRTVLPPQLRPLVQDIVSSTLRSIDFDPNPYNHAQYRLLAAHLILCPAKIRDATEILNYSDAFPRPLPATAAPGGVVIISREPDCIGPLEDVARRLEDVFHGPRRQVEHAPYGSSSQSETARTQKGAAHRYAAEQARKLSRHHTLEVIPLLPAFEEARDTLERANIHVPGVEDSDAARKSWTWRLINRHGEAKA